MDSSAAKPNDEKIFELLTEQKKSILKKLLRNVLFQAIAIAIGLSYVWNFSADIHAPLEFPIIGERILKVLVPVVLLVLFVELGYALGQFFHIVTLYKGFQEKLIQQYVDAMKPADSATPVAGDKEDKTIENLKRDLRISFMSFNIFDQLAARSKTKEGKRQFALAVICILLVFWANHFVVFESIFLLTPNLGLRILFITIALLIFCYFYLEYYYSEHLRRHSPPDATSLICILTGIAALAYFIVKICVWEHVF